MTNKPILEWLKTTEFASDLKPDHLEKLAAMATEVTFDEADIIFSEGDTGDLVYLLREGQVAIDVHVPSRGWTTVLTIGPGQLLGWSSLFDSHHKTATGRVVMPTQAIAFKATQLRELSNDDPELGGIIAWRIARLIATRLKITRLQLMDIFTPVKMV